MMPGASEQLGQVLGSLPSPSEPAPCPPPLPADTSDKDEATTHVTEASQEGEELAEETKIPLHILERDLATRAASAAPLRRDVGQEKKEKAEAQKNALLNPRPQPTTAPKAGGNRKWGDNAIEGFDPSKYEASVLRLRGTLSVLQGKVASNSPASYISVDDLDTMYTEFETFMNCHPIYSPTARHARALAAAGAVGYPAPMQRAAQPPPKQRAPKKSTAKAAPSREPQMTSLSDLSAGTWQHSQISRLMPPAPGGQINLSQSLHTMFPRGLPGQSQISPGSAYSTISTYAPYMSQDQITAAAGPADSAAIAIATAAAMAGNGTNHNNNTAALELLQVLSAAQHREQNMEQDDPDEYV